MSYTIYVDSDNAIRRCQDDSPGLGRALARSTFRTAEGPGRTVAPRHLFVILYL